jgi:uncharacterized repeat protein (TIGR03803 family)
MQGERPRILFVTAFTVAFGFLIIATPLFAVSQEKVLYDFKGTDGAKPGASLIFDAAGNLYGTTSIGGSYGTGCGGQGCGTVFKLVPGANGKWTETVLHSFTGGSDGSQPFNSLIFDVAGNLYGTTSDGGAYGTGCGGYGGYGCGTVFQLTRSANGKWTEKVLHSFGNGKDGADPAGLAFDAHGNLYGTTIGGGAYGGAGTVFQLAPGAHGKWTEKVLHSFSYENYDGYSPWAGVIFDTAGNLYGTTSAGGTNSTDCNSDGCGTVFQLTPGAKGKWKEKLLHSFGFGKDGFLPYAGLIIDAAGNLYGTTYYGGARNLGTVFRLTPEADGEWREQVLHSFGNGNDGFDPVAGLTIDAAGNLYGSTPDGGVYGNNGTVFRLAPGTGGNWKETLLHSFDANFEDGFAPFAGVIFHGSTGNLYGTTFAGPGGSQGYGTVFEIMP